MAYTIEKQQIETKARSVLDELLQLLPTSPSITPLDQLLADIKNDYYTVVVVGEFKHGKSTFVNALLEEKLMPVDVTPTTATINAIFYGEKRELHVVKSNGEIEKQELSEETLSQYIASADFDPNDIKYLKIFLPSPLLKNRVVLVDTPGVNDLNQHRSEITHQFIPRADAILFMVDMRTPVKKTEEQFLKQIINKEGIKRVLFAANFLDRIDEEEIDDVTDFIERRIQFITEGEKPQVYPLSALEGLEAKLEDNHELLDLSGFKLLEEAVQDLLESGLKSNEKLERYSTRLNLLASNIQAEIDAVRHFSSQSIEQLEAQQEVIIQWFSERNEWYKQVEHYINERDEEIKFIVRKSIGYFGERLKKDIANRIELFHGADMKPFIEKQLPMAIKSQFEQWIDQYSDYIQELFFKLEKEISKGLSDSFQQTIKVQNKRHIELQIDTDIPYIEANTGNSYVKAGFVIGGASTIALILGASFFIPVVGMAGLPFLQNKIMQKQMENVKPSLLMAMDEQLSLLLTNFSNQLDEYIDTNIFSIRQHTIQQFEQQVEYMKVTIDEQVNEKKRATGELQKRLEELTLFSNRLEEVLKEGEHQNERVPNA